MSNNMCDDCGADIAPEGNLKHKRWHARIDDRLGHLEKARADFESDVMQLDLLVQRVASHVNRVCGPPE